MTAKTAWGIRHLRHWWHSYWAWRRFDGFASHYWLIPSEADLDDLDAIRRGDA